MRIELRTHRFRVSPLYIKPRDHMLNQRISSNTVIVHRFAIHLTARRSADLRASRSTSQPISTGAKILNWLWLRGCSHFIAQQTDLAAIARSLCIGLRDAVAVNLMLSAIVGIYALIICIGIWNKHFRIFIIGNIDVCKLLKPNKFDGGGRSICQENVKLQGRHSGSFTQKQFSHI